MHIVTRKSEVNIYLDQCIKTYHSKGLLICVDEIQKQILSKKVKFPLLEYCAEQFYQEIISDDHIQLCDQIELLKQEGGNVLLGKILQLRLPDCHQQSIVKATEYIARADIWYVCDIIGERVYGHALLTQSESTLLIFKKLFNHPCHWVIRALGAGIHYATKKGVEKQVIAAVFPLLLSMASSKNKEVRQGIGWAAKTIAKFHPELIKSFIKRINHPTDTANWFRKKIELGLNRNKYAKRNYC